MRGKEEREDKLGKKEGRDEGGRNELKECFANYCIQYVCHEKNHGTYHKSPSAEDRKTQRSLGLGFLLTMSSNALPTIPFPPVTMMTAVGAWSSVGGLYCFLTGGESDIAITCSHTADQII